MEGLGITRKVCVTVAAAAVAFTVGMPAAVSAQGLYTGTPAPNAGTADTSAPAASSSRVVAASVRTQGSSGLALTGSDVAGLGLVGLGAVATGSILVRRGRRTA